MAVNPNAMFDQKKKKKKCQHCQTSKDESVSLPAKLFDKSANTLKKPSHVAVL